MEQAMKEPGAFAGIGMFPVSYLGTAFLIVPTPSALTRNESKRLVMSPFPRRKIIRGMLSVGTLVTSPAATIGCIRRVSHS
jgi:hypothetical protein